MYLHRRMNELNKCKKVTPILAKDFIDDVKEGDYTAFKDLFLTITCGFDQGEFLNIVLSNQGTFEERAIVLLKAYEQSIAEQVDGYVDDELNKV